MKKLFLLSIFTFLFQSPLMLANPVDIMPVAEEVVVAKEVVKKKKGNFFSRLKEKMINRRIKKALRKKKRKNFFNKVSDRILQNRIGKMAKKLGLGKYDCTKIVTTDGEEIDVKLVSVKDSNVKYQKCNSDVESIITTSTDNVFIIKSTIGEETVYTDIESIETKSKIKKSLKKSDDTSGAWGLGFLLGFLGGLLAVLLVYLLMEDDPRKEKMMKGAWMGVLLSVLLVLIYIVVVVVYATSGV